MSERRCGTCSLCCKILTIHELSKFAGTWCSNCRPGKGCTIYADRPEVCRSFHCGWILAPDMGEELRPDRCHFIVRMDDQPMTVRVDVDPRYPGAVEGAALVKMRQGLNANGLTVIVNDGSDSTVHLPDGTRQPMIEAESLEHANAEAARRGLPAGSYYVQLP